MDSRLICTSSCPNLVKGKCKKYNVALEKKGWTNEYFIKCFICRNQINTGDIK